MNDDWTTLDEVLSALPAATFHLPRNCGRAEIIHLLEPKINAEFFICIVAQLVLDPKRDSGLDRGHAILKVVHVNVEKLSLVHFGLLDG